MVCSARSSSSKAFGTTSRYVALPLDEDYGNPHAKGIYTYRLLEIYQTLRRIVAIKHDTNAQSLLFDKIRSIVQDIRDDEVSTVHSFLQSPDIREETSKKIREDCEELLGYIAAVKRFNLDVNGRSKDKMVSFGEKLSCRLMTAMLQDRHVEAEYVDLSDIIPGNGSKCLEPGYFLEAAIVFGERITACNDRVPVITGFFGTVPGSLIDGDIGRGYSDLCAVLVAIGLRAERIQIWKEVDGVFTADPREVPDARCLPSITPSEAAELTFYGSQVIHHLALTLAIQAEPPICIFVNNVQKPWGQGTVIVPDTVKDITPPQIDCLDSFDSDSTPPSSLSSETCTLSRMPMPTAVTIKRDISVLNILSNKQSMSHGFFVKVFTILADRGISVDLISTSQVQISMAINNSNTDAARIDDARVKLAKEGEVNVVVDMAVLSLVGAELNHMTGIAGRMFSILGEHNVNIEMISQGTCDFPSDGDQSQRYINCFYMTGASEINISCVIPATDATRAMNVLHAELLTIS